MDMQPREDNKKRSYETPTLRVVELVSEEVLGTGCKVFSGDPSGVSGNGCMVSVCSSTAGS